MGPSTSARELLRVEIPGDPVAQGRGRAVPTAAGIRVMDPERAKSWKGAAQVHMLEARERASAFGPFGRPLFVTVIALFRRPAKAPAGATWRASRPDADNLGKAVLDAGNSVLWHDDDQVVRLTVEKRFAAAGEAARVVVVLEDIGEPT